jgi:hypothetical protein
MFPACVLDRFCNLSSCPYSASRYSQRVKTQPTAKSNNFAFCNKSARSKRRESECVLVIASVGLLTFYL